MKTTLFVPVVAALAAILTAASLTTADAATYDLNAAWGDGSATSNPNGPWSLRYGDELLANHYWLESEAAWIWDWNGSTVPSFNFTRQSKWNDCQPGDIIMQGNFGGQPGNIRWTAPSDGVIDISGRTWDAYGGRAGSWTLAVGAAQVAAGTIAANSTRTSAGVTFAENLLPGKSLTSVPVVAGTTVVFTQDSASSGVKFTVTYHIVGNVRAAQRPGTKLVDIDYDLTHTVNPVYVTLEISADGGTTWAVPATALTGAVGANVMPGNNLRITWNAGTDWNNQISPNVKFRLRVSEPLPEQTDFALVPAGEFTMGDSLDGLTNAPPHTVNLSAFYMQKKGVTKADWDAVRAWGLDHGYTDLAFGEGKAPDHPVQTVSWYDMVKWCNTRSEKEGLTPCYYMDAAQTVVYRTGNADLDNSMVKWTANGHRLPTEAEREKAARGGQAGLRFPWGNTISHTEANFYNSDGESYQTGTTGYHPTYATGATPYTSPVGSFAANAFGIYDMAGNVWEFCWDWYGDLASSPTTDPTGPLAGPGRVIRGGSCAEYSAGSCRAASRTASGPASPWSTYGFRTVRSNLTFALIPGGTFTMGDTLDGMTDAPPHPVNVSTFYMQKLGVTKADWDAVRDWGLANGYTDLAVGAGKAADHPVQTVTWYDAVKWCNANSEMDGLTPCYYTDAGQTAVYRTGNTDIDNTMVKWTANGYRLPTEAEREKAARGGQVGLRFPWGNTISHANANFYNDGGESYQTGTGGYDPTWGTGAQPYTSPVGSFPANAYGIYDMAGNVWEWCWDRYASGYYASSPTTDPTGPSGSTRVFRGGCWNNNANGPRAAIRGDNSPGSTGSTLGFRPVRINNGTSPPSTNTPVDTRDWFNLTINALHGTTDPAAGTYQHSPGVIVPLTALTADPLNGYLFSKWTIGTGPSAPTSTANPLSVTMDSDKTITAVFANDTRDPDGDGLTNYQELVQYAQFHCDPNNRDTDGDGFWDGVEINRGTNPSDPASRPDMAMAIRTAVEVSIETALGQHYQIESSIDLLTWTPAGDGISDDGTGHIVHGGHIVGTGATITLWYSTKDLPQRHFRAVRIPPP